MAYEKKVKLELTIPLVRRDGVVSSDYADAKPFMPSYMRKCQKPEMFTLMSMGYQRQWMKEKRKFDRKAGNAISKAKARQRVKQRYDDLEVKRLQRIADRIVPVVVIKRTKIYDHVQSRYDKVFPRRSLCPPSK